MDTDWRRLQLKAYRRTANDILFSLFTYLHTYGFCSLQLHLRQRFHGLPRGPSPSPYYYCTNTLYDLYYVYTHLKFPARVDYTAVIEAIRSEISHRGNPAARLEDFSWCRHIAVNPTWPPGRFPPFIPG